MLSYAQQLLNDVTGYRNENHWQGAAWVQTSGEVLNYLDDGSGNRLFTVAQPAPEPSSLLIFAVCTLSLLAVRSGSSTRTGCRPDPKR
jgi:hypothetical protein